MTIALCGILTVTAIALVTAWLIRRKKKVKNDTTASGNGTGA